MARPIDRDRADIGGQLGAKIGYDLVLAGDHDQGGMAGPGGKPRRQLAIGIEEGGAQHRRLFAGQEVHRVLLQRVFAGGLQLGRQRMAEGDIKIGMRVQLAFEPVTKDITLPYLVAG